MIKFENTEVLGWEHAIRGMRNPLNSWNKSDSCWGCTNNPEDDSRCDACDDEMCAGGGAYRIGPNDKDLMRRLRNAGTDHRKFMRMITVYADITAPLYWWKEYDTYKVGTVANSCSTMHKIADKEFTLDDFSCEHLLDQPHNRDWLTSAVVDEDFMSNHKVWATPLDILRFTIEVLNGYRSAYLETGDKEDWWQMIQLLPSSYNQRRTVMLNYEVLANIYKSRKNHKLDEWRELCEWIETLPYYELITGQTETADTGVTFTFAPNQISEEAKKLLDDLMSKNPGFLSSDPITPEDVKRKTRSSVGGRSRGKKEIRGYGPKRKS